MGKRKDLTEEQQQAQTEADLQRKADESPVSRYCFTVHVVPPSKKNSQEIGRRGKRLVLVPSKSYVRATALAIPQLAEQWGGKAPLTGPVQMCCTFHVLSESDSANCPDLPNLYHAPADWMQPTKWNKKKTRSTPGAGVIVNDRQVKSTDGSRVICECDACADRKPGCNYRFEPVLYTSGKRKGEQRMKRDGKTPMKVKVQVCRKAKIEIELTEMETDQ